MTTGMKFKAYITKYALTNGIELVDAELCFDISPTIIMYRHDGNESTTYAHHKEWHRTLDAALERAEEMRSAKIKALKKQIIKLENIKFDIPK